MSSLLQPWLSPDPHKAAVELAWLRTTPVWAGITGALMVTGVVSSFGDVALTAYGLTMLGIAWWGPLRAEDPRPFAERTGVKMATSVTLLALGLNYTQTPFFFDVLHMHYGFNATWTIAYNPVFLYLVSVAYFTTYFSLCTLTWRALRQRLPGAAGRLAAGLLAPLAMALLETLLNANPFTTRLFCYDDMPLMLTFGTLSYGVAFAWVLPVWAWLDEDAGHRVTLGQVAAGTLAAMYADLLTLDLLRYHVAPWLTEVEPGAMNLRDFGSSCLISP